MMASPQTEHHLAQYYLFQLFVNSTKKNQAKNAAELQEEDQYWSFDSKACAWVTSELFRSQGPGAEIADFRYRNTGFVTKLLCVTYVHNFQRHQKLSPFVNQRWLYGT